MAAHLRCTVLNACFMLIAAAGRAMAEEAGETQTQAAAKSAYENQLICKRVYVTGSNIPKKVCKTRAQMDRDAQATRQYRDEMGRNSGWRVPGGRGDPRGGSTERAPGPL
jgi:hypothetical protein